MIKKVQYAIGFLLVIFISITAGVYFGQRSCDSETARLKDNAKQFESNYNGLKATNSSLETTNSGLRVQLDNQRKIIDGTKTIIENLGKSVDSESDIIQRSLLAVDQIISILRN